MSCQFEISDSVNPVKYFLKYILKDNWASLDAGEGIDEVNIAIENGKIMYRRRNTERVVLVQAQRNIVELDIP